MNLPGLTGRRMTLAEIKNWRDNMPEGAERRRNGRTPDQRMADLQAREETRLNQQRIARYQRLHEGAVQGVGELADWLDDAIREVEAACTRMRQTGDPSEVLQIALRRGNLIPRLVAAVEELDKDEEAAATLVDMDVEEFQQAELERLPMLADALPFVTAEWLEGDRVAVAPFVGGASS